MPWEAREGQDALEDNDALLVTVEPMEAAEDTPRTEPTEAEAPTEAVTKPAATDAIDPTLAEAATKVTDPCELWPAVVPCEDKDAIAGAPSRPGNIRALLL